MQDDHSKEQQEEQMMLRLLETALDKKKIEPEIHSHDKKSYSDMLRIESQFDEIATADKQKMDFYIENRMPWEAEQMRNQINTLTLARAGKITKFLEKILGVEAKEKPLILRDGADPRFGNCLHAPKHYRVAIKSEFTDTLHSYCCEKDEVYAAEHQEERKERNQIQI